MIFFRVNEYRTIFLKALAVVLSCDVATASEFLAEFERLKKAGDSKEIRTFLADSADEEKDNPDYYATAGNYWWGVSRSVSITAKPTEGDDFSVRDQETGEEVGSISTVGQINPEIPKRAVDTLSEGVRRFPHRADIALGLASVRREMGFHKECVDTLLALLEVTRKAPESLRWTRNEPLPSEAGEFIPEAIHGYTATLFQGDTDETDALCVTLCDGIIKAFPEHPFAYNIKAALADSHGKPDEALQYIETAHSKAPGDPLILLNLGDMYLKAEEREKARQAYARILAMEDIDESMKKQATEAMRKSAANPEKLAD